MRNAALLIAAFVAAVCVAGVAAQDDDARAVDGYTYLYSTDLYKKQTGDVIRTFDTLIWDNGQNPKGMHKCARYCKKEGGGGVCNAWTFCWDVRRCHLLSRLPSNLGAAKPVANPLNRTGNTYNAKCASGYSEAVATTVLLSATCKATIHSNTLFSDSLALTSATRSRAIRAEYDANQPSAAHCCALCADFKDEGCIAWTYQPDGWLLDRSRKCTLRQGVNPSVSTVRGVTSGVMN